MPKDKSMMITPTIAQVILARAADIFSFSPPEVAHWIPAQMIIMTETVMPAIMKISMALPMTFETTPEPGCGSVFGTSMLLPLIESDMSSFIGLCNYHTVNI